MLGRVFLRAAEAGAHTKRPVVELLVGAECQREDALRFLAVFQLAFAFCVTERAFGLWVGKFDAVRLAGFVVAEAAELSGSRPMPSLRTMLMMLSAACWSARARSVAAASLVLLELAGFQDLQRAHGKREADRMLQAVTHQLLLNLRNHDLLCRYAGERLAVLLPGTPLVAAERSARHLQQMVGLTHFHTGDGEACASLRLLSACAELDDEPDALLARLNRELEGTALCAQTAQHFGISPATLKRRLLAHGTHFQAELDQVRTHVALQLHQCRGHDNEQVARHLGCSDAANFRRSFKRWTGLTPSSLRDSLDRPLMA